MLVLSQKLQNSITYITSHLKSLHWLKITQRIQYKILSLTYKSLQYTYNKSSSISDPRRATNSLYVPAHLHAVVSLIITLLVLPIPLESRLKIFDRYFIYKLLLFGMLYHTVTPSSFSFCILLKLILCSHYLHKQLKAHFFLSFLSSLACLSTGLITGTLIRPVVCHNS